MYFCIIIAFILAGCSQEASMRVALLENMQNVADPIAALLNKYFDEL